MRATITTLATSHFRRRAVERRYLEREVFIARGVLEGYGSVTRFIDRAEAEGVEVIFELHSTGDHGFEGGRPRSAADRPPCLDFVVRRLTAR